MSRYEQFDSRLLIKPLAGRQHDLQLDRWLSFGDPISPFERPDLATMGAHILRGFVDHIAMNGAGITIMEMGTGMRLRAKVGQALPPANPSAARTLLY